MAAGSGSGGSKAIERGSAFIRIGANLKPLDVALKQIPKKLQSIGKKLAGVGAGMFAGGGAGLAGIAGLSKSFIDAGSDATDAAARLNTTTETITSLGYAAALAGGDISDVEFALGKMQKKIADEAGEGDEFFAGLLGKDVDGQLAGIADRIASISDPTLQSAEAMEIFGTKLGRKMLPFLKDGAAGLKELRKQAGKDGAIIGSDEAERADRLGDAMTRVLTVIKSVGRALGDAFLPSAASGERFAGVISNIGSQIRTFIAQNSDLIKTIGLVAAGVTAAGATILALGTTIAAAGAIIGGVVGVVTFLLSPIGLLTAGIIALGVQIVRTSNMFEGWSETFGGIKNALASGDLGLAAQIGFAAIEIEFTKLINKLTSLWRDFKDQISKVFGDLKMISTLRPSQVIKGFFGYDMNLTKEQDAAVRDNAKKRFETDNNPNRDADLREAEAKQKRALEAMQAQARMQALMSGIGSDIQGGLDWWKKFGKGGPAAMQNMMGGENSQVKSLFGNRAAGAALNIGNDAEIPKLLKRGTEAGEKTANLLEKSKPIVWES